MKSGLLNLLVASVVMCVLAASASAGSVKMHESRRYFQDASGKPVFLMGHHSWASVAPAYYNDSPQRYVDMIVKGASYKVNYLRLSLGINALGGKGTRYWEVDPTPTPFVYENGKANLDKWNQIFWDGLRYHAELARRNGIMLHVCLFDGVDIRCGSQQHRWINSFWNVKNQTRDFYGDLDVNGDGNADQNGEFYRTNDLKNDEGIGHYQRRLIDKALEVTKGYDNVFYEVGNELLGSRADWNAAVIDYVKSKTDRAITQNGGRIAYNAEGVAEHNPNTSADVKRSLEQHVGRGKPFWLDPDGSRLMQGSAEDLRRAVWYSFVGGAAGWGGFVDDYWDQDFDVDTVTYYKHLAEFIGQSGVRFWEMEPHHDLVSNGKVNSCLAKEAFEYVVYVLNDPEVTVNLNDVTNTATFRTYDPRTGDWSDKQTVEGRGRRKFTRPPGAEDWAIHIRGA